MADAKPEVLAFVAFPRMHWQKIWSCHPPRADQQTHQMPTTRYSQGPRNARGESLVLLSVLRVSFLSLRSPEHQVLISVV